MNREDVFNFSAGPSVLPTEVLQTAAAELLNYHGSGLSVMEMSHRSREFMDIFAATKAKLKRRSPCRTRTRSCFCRAARRSSFR